MSDSTKSLKADFTRWGIDHKATGAQPIPYLDLDGEDEPIDFLFSFNEHPLIARGNLQTLKGSKKAGKSAGGIMLIDAAIGGEFLGIRAQHEGMKLLWLDTEQDRNTLRQRAKAAIKMAGVASSPEGLRIVPLKTVAPVERLEMTLRAIKDSTPDFVFLDGIVDLCEDFNDNKESARVVGSLLKATEEFNLAMLCIIHVNKGDDNARGHVGTILEQKSSEIFELTKAGGNARMRLCNSRFADIPDITFKFGDDFTIKAAERATSDGEVEREELAGCYATLFKKAASYRYTDLVGAYMEQEGKGERTAKESISKAVKAGVLQKSGIFPKTLYTFMYPLYQEPGAKPRVAPSPQNNGDKEGGAG